MAASCADQSSPNNASASATLRAASEPWKIGIFHHPLYSDAGRHGSNLDLRVVMEPVLVFNLLQSIRIMTNVFVVFRKFLVEGLTANTATQTVVTPPLFYNLLNRSVMISAQISASLTEKGVSAQTGNTYNFTISPRG